MENSFGSVPPAGEDGKPPGVHIKEELGKELPSPDSLKPVSCRGTDASSKRKLHPQPPFQGMPSKLIKTEGVKEIKTEPGQSLPSQSPQHMSPYSSLYPRIGLPSMSREEDIQK
jgi:hypothetical protein